MNFFKKLLKDDDELYNSEYKNDFSAEQDSGELIDDVPTAGGENVAAGESAGGKEVSLRVMRPKGYDDGPEIADYVVIISGFYVFFHKVNCLISSRYVNTTVFITFVLHWHSMLNIDNIINSLQIFEYLINRPERAILIENTGEREFTSDFVL